VNSFTAERMETSCVFSIQSVAMFIWCYSASFNYWCQTVNHLWQR